MKKSPYAVVKSRHVTEKATMLEGLKDATSNKSLSRCKSPKYTFLVNPKASKQEIADAVVEIYGVKVEKVNTILVKPKARFLRGRRGKTRVKKKAIVTLKTGEEIE